MPVAERPPVEPGQVGHGQQLAVPVDQWQAATDEPGHPAFIEQPLEIAMPAIPADIYEDEPGEGADGSGFVAEPEQHREHSEDIIEGF